jgi:hypothetical protein
LYSQEDMLKVIEDYKSFSKKCCFILSRLNRRTEDYYSYDSVTDTPYINVSKIEHDKIYLTWPIATSDFDGNSSIEDGEGSFPHYLVLLDGQNLIDAIKIENEKLLLKQKEQHEKGEMFRREEKIRLMHEIAKSYGYNVSRS